MESIALGKSGILTHKRMLKLFFKVNDAGTVFYSFKSVLVIRLSEYIQKSWSHHSWVLWQKQYYGGADAKSISTLIYMSETLQQGTIQCVSKHTQTFYVHRHTLWAGMFKHAKCPSSTEAQRWQV